MTAAKPSPALEAACMAFLSAERANFVEHGRFRLAPKMRAAIVAYLLAESARCDKAANALPEDIGDGGYQYAGLITRAAICRDIAIELAPAPAATAGEQEGG